jgi:dGTPase
VSATLAPYAFRVEQSRGRRYAEPAHPYRNDFQRDRDRVIHSRAFRRLENKTQVFTRRFSDHFRTRLTHTLEVAQIARTVAQQLGLNQELVEVLALVHDIGHPPFGHAGEQALDKATREHGLFFDHNLHALRIVEKFEQRYAAFAGLNLTFEVREGIIKHSRMWEAAKFPELREYLLDEQPPLEAQLIDAADEIAYNTADLDDGYESDIVSIEQIREAVPVFERFFGEAHTAHGDVREKLKFNEAIKRMLDRMATDLIGATRARLEAQGVKSVEDIRRNPARLAGFGEEVEQERRVTKEFLHRTLYFSEQLTPEKHHAEQVIVELFRYWMKNPLALPESYQRQAEREPAARVVCDYIAGMTDNFILDLHREVFRGEGSRSTVQGSQ